ncbi:hypothetical protein [Mucilaginibacter sp.]|uniref:hypothetical protein n=1 Tax=Mucilaginibacter sp. TaxID=1882438 RepID=UPI003AFFFE75
MLTSADSTTILKFTSSDEKGNFRITLSENEMAQNGLLLKVQLLGYEPQIKPLQKGQSVYNFTLTEAPIFLKDVVVKGGKPQFKFSGDTTSYLVKDFASVQDRTIGDVLKRIPGISVEDNGLIKFNGKSVKKLYLDGDDLLDDKYSIGTRTIPQRIVNEIQVLENHQRIKALEGKVFSDDVDINLNFKEDAGLKVVGQIQAGAGVPKLYDEDANAISLKKKYKSITQLKLNNTGNSLFNDVLSLNELQDRVKRGFTPEQAQLSAGTGSSPQIEQNRYLFNNSGLLNSNNLWKLKSGIQIKSKAYFEYDNQRQRYQNLTSIYLPQDTVNYTERQDNRKLAQNAYADLIIFINKPAYYLNNASVFKYTNEDDNAYLLANSKPLTQQYFANSYDFSNELNLIKSPKGKVFTEYYAYLNYRKSPEQLLIDSAAYPAIFQTNLPLKTVSQTVNIPTFYTNDYVNLRVATGKVLQSYKIGLSAKLQQFNSALQATNLQNELVVPDSSANALRWKELKTYIEPNYEFHSGDFRLIAKLPLFLQQLSFGQQNSNQHYNRLLFNPSINFRYDRQKGFAGNVFYTRTDNAGNLLQSYNNLVLNNYRSVSQNNNLLSVYQRNQLGILLSYKDPVKIFFVNLSGNAQINNYNTINYSIISRELSATDREPYDNVSKSINGQANISKYIFDLNTSVSGGFGIQFGQNNQVLNRVVFPFLSFTNTYNVSVTGSIGKKFRYDYDFRLSTSKNRPKQTTATINTATATLMRNKLGLEYNISDFVYLKATGTNELNQNNTGLNANYNFVDFSARYRLVKLKTDLQLEMNNLGNIKNYQTVVLSSNTQYNYQYPLRGRMILLKAFFIF